MEQYIADNPALVVEVGRILFLALLSLITILWGSLMWRLGRVEGDVAAMKKSHGVDFKQLAKDLKAVEKLAAVIERDSKIRSEQARGMHDAIEKLSGTASGLIGTLERLDMADRERSVDVATLKAEVHELGTEQASIKTRLQFLMVAAAEK